MVFQGNFPFGISAYIGQVNAPVRQWNCARGRRNPFPECALLAELYTFGQELLFRRLGLNTLAYWSIYGFLVTSLYGVSHTNPAMSRMRVGELSLREKRQHRCGLTCHSPTIQGRAREWVTIGNFISVLEIHFHKHIKLQRWILIFYGNHVNPRGMV